VCAQVVGFLSPLSPAWDLSLMFVMGGALLVALPGECVPLTRAACQPALLSPRGACCRA
jgi:hypothetical protein